MENFIQKMQKVISKIKSLEAHKPTKTDYDEPKIIFYNQEGNIELGSTSFTKDIKDYIYVEKFINKDINCLVFDFYRDISGKMLIKDKPFIGTDKYCINLDKYEDIDKAQILSTFNEFFTIKEIHDILVTKQQNPISSTDYKSKVRDLLSSLNNNYFITDFEYALQDLGTNIAVRSKKSMINPRVTYLPVFRNQPKGAYVSFKVDELGYVDGKGVNKVYFNLDLVKYNYKKEVEVLLNNFFHNYNLSSSVASPGVGTDTESYNKSSTPTPLISLKAINYKEVLANHLYYNAKKECIEIAKEEILSESKYPLIQKKEPNKLKDILYFENKEIAIVTSLQDGVIITHKGVKKNFKDISESYKVYEIFNNKLIKEFSNSIKSKNLVLKEDNNYIIEDYILTKEIFNSIKNKLSKEDIKVEQVTEESKIKKKYQLSELVAKDSIISTTLEEVLDHPINIEAREWALLVGPSGSGKTSVAVEYAKKKGKEFVLLPGNAQLTVDDLLGYKSITTGEYFSSLLRDAVENGKIFILDEIDACNPNTLLCLNSLKNNYFQFPDKLVKVHKDFRLIATANTLEYNEEYLGRSPMDKATIDRFDIIEYRLEAHELALRYGLQYINYIEEEYGTNFHKEFTPRVIERKVNKLKIKGI